MKLSELKIYFIHQGKISFIKRDLDLLMINFKINEINNYKSSVKNFVNNIWGVFSSDIIFCWFGSLRYFLPIIIAKLTSKKVIIVAGGYDVASLKEINYGNR